VAKDVYVFANNRFSETFASSHDLRDCLRKWQIVDMTLWSL
jgi:hypothetical protein